MGGVECHLVLRKTKRETKINEVKGAGSLIEECLIFLYLLSFRLLFPLVVDFFVIFLTFCHDQISLLK